MASRKPVTRPSMRHPSHNHPLRGYKAQAEDDIICSGCDLDLIGAAYKCTKSECDYFLHKSCVELPREIRHKSHPNHPLNLLYSSTYDNSEYFCDACGQSGTGFGYNCSICQYDIHVGCVSMPETMQHEKHTHPLTLLYSVPSRFFTCDVCEEMMNNMWFYYCQKCNYATHLHSCVANEEEEPKKAGGSGGNGARRESSSANSELEAMLKAHREMEKMQIDLHLQMQRDKIDKKSRKNILNSI